MNTVSWINGQKVRPNRWLTNLFETI